MSAAIKIDMQEVRIGLGEFKAAAEDRAAMLNICGNQMRDSIAYTFREEGSPAGSWPALAAATLKRKGYTSGHKLLILSGRLFGSFTYVVDDDTLTIGTNVVYAAVHRYGSRDFAFGPRTQSQHLATLAIAAYRGLRTAKPRYANVRSEGKDGKARNTRRRVAGPVNATQFDVKAHTRHQNIPPRPFLVFRPEDPTRMQLGIDAYLRGKAVRIGSIASTGGAA